MRIFITGGTGFIGSHLVKRLEKEGHNLLLLSPQPKDQLHFQISDKTEFLKGDLSQVESWKNETKRFQPETTIHLAWEGIPDYGPQMSIKNLHQGLRLISFLADIGCKSVLSAGSCWEYGGQPGKLSEDITPRPLNAFTAAKNAIHLLGKEIAKESSMRFIWTRFFYVYGPIQKKESLIPHLINYTKEGKAPEIKNPSAQNDFIYVEDVAEAISLLVQNCKKDGVYNIGSGHLTSVQDIIKIIYDYFGRKEEYKKTIPGSTDVYSEFWADISKIKKDAGWLPKTDIKEGIIKTIDHLHHVK